MRRPAVRTGGFALVAVLIVLVALFALSAPFLMSARNADASSARLADQAQARLALDAAARHARAVLSSSHPAVDVTPAYDGEGELTVDNRFDEAFLDASDPDGVMWDVVAADVAGLIDPGSAPPQVFANLLGAVTRLAESAQEGDTRLVVASSGGFSERGYAWVEDELVGWSLLTPNGLEGVTRGHGADEEAPSGCGPQPARAHALGALVVDQAVWALARWRILGPAGFRTFDGIEDFSDAAPFALGEKLPDGALARLARTTSVHADVRGGARWQRAARIVQPVEVGEPGCRLVVSDGRWFNAGTTVRVEGAGETELALVRWANGGLIELTEPLRTNHDAFEAVVRPLARRPVNLNSAPPAVLHALFVNLKLRGANGWITPSEADQLVALVRAARPLTGFEDLLRRVVLPAAGLDDPGVDGGAASVLLQSGEDAGGFLERADALAVYKNGLNANDAELELSTMPYCFASRDVHALELRAIVNAPSGAARTTHVRDDVQLMVPQRDLLTVWTRQRDFDEATRLDAAAGGWVSGPENTLRHDVAQRFGRPSGARAQLGPYDPAPISPISERTTLTFASDDEAGYVQLAPSRVDEEDTNWSLRARHVLHFDDDTGSPEGRLLSEQPLALSPDELPVEWIDGDGLLAPFTFEAWIRPRGASPGTRLLDVGGPFTDSDRVSLVVEVDELVLRVLGPAEDHSSTGLEEVAEVRYPIDTDPGLPLDTWTHVSLDVRGNRPDQLTFLVDGRVVGETPGLTRLTNAIAFEDERIVVESTEGFPDACVLRIGSELVEAEVVDDTRFRARFHPDGPLAGFGGRLAREIVFGVDPQINTGELDKGGSHEAGTPVALYGYSLPLAAHAPASNGPLAVSLGAFAVARAVGVTGTSPEPVFVQLNNILPTNIGWGMIGANSKVDGLLLDVADQEAELADVLSAFSERGGYAVLLGPFEPGDYETSTSDPLGGAEVIRYSGIDGNRLILASRGDQLPGLPGLRGSTLAQRSAFVFDWNDGLGGVTVGGANLGPNERLDLQTIVVPISVPAGVTAGGLGFYDSEGESDFAQITRLGTDSALTEWVRYDEVAGGQLVRSDPRTLLELRRRAHAQSYPLEAILDELGDPELEPVGGDGLVAESRAALPPVPGAAGQDTGSDPQLWRDTLGLPEDEDLPLTRALDSFLRHRGVLGTFSHAHPQGTLILPVWKAIATYEESAGWPGRFDAVTLFDGDPALPGFPGVVQHAHRPLDSIEYTWVPGSEPLSAEPGVTAAVPETGFDTNATYVALQQPLGVPIVPELGANGLVLGEESRLLARVTLFPSGELPRAVTDVAVGGTYAGGSEVPDFLVDEVVFGRPLLETDEGGTSLVLEEAFDENEASSIKLSPNLLRTALGDRTQSIPVVDELPEDAVLLRLGDEVLCAIVDGSSGRLRLATDGRGLLGTRPQAHAIAESVVFLSAARVSVLSAAVDAEDAFLPLAGTDGFPPSGLVLIDQELVHYTSLDGSALAMPRFSREPGRRDGRGGGLFRGRFGTDAAGHAEETPVLLFPFRYPDRWAERADAPELAWYGLSFAQPAAFWRSVFWEVENSPLGGPSLGVLQRSRGDVPWDAAPQDGSGLRSMLDGPLVERGIPLGFQADLVEWRVFARHEAGAFDAEEGLSHAWKTTPQLRLFGVDWFAPSILLGSLER